MSYSCNRFFLFSSVSMSSDTSSPKPVCAIVVGKLSIESSYAKNEERDAEERFDTVQYFILPNAIWRIRTFALDNDIHVSVAELDEEQPLENSVDRVVESTKRSYEDVWDDISVFYSPSATAEALQELFETGDMTGSIEGNDQEMLFWNPDGATYKTISQPE